MLCVDLGESFPTSIYLQKSASIQPRTSPSKFGGKLNSVFIRFLRHGPCSPYLWKCWLYTWLLFFISGLIFYAVLASNYFSYFDCAYNLIPNCQTEGRPDPTSSQLSSAAGVLLGVGGAMSRRAAAGRAELLARRGHTGRVQNPAKVSENRPACGTAQHTLAVCFVFEKLEKSRKNLVKIWRKFSKI